MNERAWQMEGGGVRDFSNTLSQRYKDIAITDAADKFSSRKNTCASQIQTTH